jgi:Flp pilus assembly protein TadG
LIGFQSFARDKRGALTIVWAGLFIMLAGVLSVAFEYTRYYSVHSKLTGIVKDASLLAAQNLDILADDHLSSFVEEFIRTGLTDSVFLLSDPTGLRIKNVSVNRANDLRQVIVSAEFSLTLSLGDGFADVTDLSIQARAQSKASTIMADIVLVMDRSLAAADAGHLSSFKTAAMKWLSQIAAVPDSQEKIRVALLPAVDQLVNVGPYEDWVSPSSWPDNLPPAVPGTVAWVGPLIEQRWCVGMRGGEASENNKVPTEIPFPLILSIETRAHEITGLPEYFIATPEACPAEPVSPLSGQYLTVRDKISLLAGYGNTDFGRSLVWADRLLSDQWQPHWRSEERTGSLDEVRKVVVLMVGSGLGEQTTQEVFHRKCSEMKNQGTDLYILDYRVSIIEDPLLSECVARGGRYFEIPDAGALGHRFATVLQSLQKGRLTSLETVF